MAIALDLGNPGDITDYSSLLDAVRRWLDRGSDLDPILSTFVANSEAVINRTLRVPEMETSATLSGSGGAFVLPLDCLKVRAVIASGRPLRATSPNALADQSYRGDAFALQGRSLLTAPTTSSVTVAYWQRVPALSTANPANWLLDQHQDVYLYGTLFQAATFIIDADAAAGWSALFDAALSAVQEAGAKARFAGPLVARSLVCEGIGGSPAMREFAPYGRAVPINVPGADIPEQWDRTEW